MKRNCYNCCRELNYGEALEGQVAFDSARNRITDVFDKEFVGWINCVGPTKFFAQKADGWMGYWFQKRIHICVKCVREAYEAEIGQPLFPGLVDP